MVRSSLVRTLANLFDADSICISSRIARTRKRSPGCPSNGRQGLFWLKVLNHCFVMQEMNVVKLYVYETLETVSACGKDLGVPSFPSTYHGTRYIHLLNLTIRPLTTSHPPITSSLLLHLIAYSRRTPQQPPSTSENTKTTQPILSRIQTRPSLWTLVFPFARFRFLWCIVRGLEGCRLWIERYLSCSRKRKVWACR